MGAEPVGERAGLPVGQHVDDPVPTVLIGQVDQDAGVGVALTLGPVIDTQHDDLPHLGVGQCPEQPEQRAPGDDHAESRASRLPALPAKAGAIRSSKARNPAVRR